MKYNDRQTQLLKRKHDNRKMSDSFDRLTQAHRKKVIKVFNKQVLSCGIDPDFWSLVDKETKYQIYSNFQIYKAMSSDPSKNRTTLQYLSSNSNENTLSLFEYIQNNKHRYGVDPAKVREKKLNRLIV